MPKNLTHINYNTHYNHKKAKSNQRTTAGEVCSCVSVCVHCTVDNCCTQLCTE